MANETDVGVLFAKTDLAVGVRGITAFIVEPKRYPGFEHTVERIARTMTVSTPSPHRRAHIERTRHAIH